MVFNRKSGKSVGVFAILIRSASHRNSPFQRGSMPGGCRIIQRGSSGRIPHQLYCVRARRASGALEPVQTNAWAGATWLESWVLEPIIILAQQAGAQQSGDKTSGVSVTSSGLRRVNGFRFHREKSRHETVVNRANDARDCVFSRWEKRFLVTGFYREHLESLLYSTVTRTLTLAEDRVTQVHPNPTRFAAEPKFVKSG